MTHTGSSISSLEMGTHTFPPTSSSRCNDVSGLWAPCLCSLEMCIGWYPCGLKYCKGKPETSGSTNNGSFRCGIKTCRKCNQYSYYVPEKQHCLWDDWPLERLARRRWCLLDSIFSSIFSSSRSNHQHTNDKCEQMLRRVVPRMASQFRFI